MADDNKMEPIDDTTLRSRVVQRLTGYIIDGKLQPMVMTLTPHDKEGEYTRMTFSELQTDVQLEDKLFSLQSLQD